MYFNFYDELYISINRPDSLYGFCSKYRKYESLPSKDVSGEKIIKLDLVDKIRAKNLYYLGSEAACNNSFFILDKKGLKFSFNPKDFFLETKISIESGFDVSLLISILEPLILVRLLLSGVIPVHSCSVEISGEGILFPAWGGTGKTRLLLNLTTSGAKFVSDEWSFVRGNSLLPYYVDFCMLDYDLSEYGDRANLSAIEKLRLLFNRKFSSHRKIIHLLNYCNLILPHKEFVPEQLFPSIASEAKLRKIYILQKWNKAEPKKDKIDPEILLDKFVLSFYRENRLLFYYYNLYKFAMSCNGGIFDDISNIYRQKMSRVLDKKKCFSLTLPMNIRNINLIDVL